MSKNDTSDDKSLSERIETIVDESKEAFKQAYQTSGVESIGENVKEAVDRALSRRENVVMVRLNTESITRVDELVEAGVVSSRSEAVAFLVSEGIGAQSELFERIGQKVEQIRRSSRNSETSSTRSPLRPRKRTTRIPSGRLA